MLCGRKNLAWLVKSRSPSVVAQALMSVAREVVLIAH